MPGLGMPEAKCAAAICEQFPQVMVALTDGGIVQFG
jgi:hypothetical protein